jgi:putative ribosome biogenesis GTPase RsgA
LVDFFFTFLIGSIELVFLFEKIEYSSFFLTAAKKLQSNCDWTSECPMNDLNFHIKFCWSALSSLKKMNKKVVNIDGNIGAGKSTLIKKLTNAIHAKDKNLSTIVIEENVDRDASTKALLKNYYQKPKMYAIEFQFWILKDKVKNFKLNFSA